MCLILEQNCAHTQHHRVANRTRTCLPSTFIIHACCLNTTKDLSFLINNTEHKSTSFLSKSTTPNIMTRLSLIAVAALPLASAFAPIAPTSVALSKPAFVQSTPLFAEVDESAESVFIAPDESKTDEDVSFAKAESLGRGAAKVSYP